MARLRSKTAVRRAVLLGFAWSLCCTLRGKRREDLAEKLGIEDADRIVVSGDGYWVPARAGEVVIEEHYDVGSVVQLLRSVEPEVKSCPCVKPSRLTFYKGNVALASIACSAHEIRVLSDSTTARYRMPPGFEIVLRFAIDRATVPDKEHGPASTRPANAAEHGP